MGQQVTLSLCLYLIFFLVVLQFVRAAGQRNGHFQVNKKTMTSNYYDISILIAFIIQPSSTIDFKHHNNTELASLMRLYAGTYPQITRLYSIGQSVQGTELWAIEISDNPGLHEIGEPELKYVANMHGNEVTGRETLLYLMQYLCSSYTTNSTVRELVDSTRIHLLPTMNPDGYSNAVEGDYNSGTGRYNFNGIDLNRNFPDRFGRQQGRVQPETQAIIDWIENHHFVLSANLHNGALVANYPYDNSHAGRNVYTPTSDEDIFRQLSLTYSYSHPTMHLGPDCRDGDGGFRDGITNGAEWYNVDGGMQDYNYLHSSCFEITIEQGCQKFPEASELESIWNENRDAMILYMSQVHIGIKGVVTNENGSAIQNAKIDVVDRSHSVYSAEGGDYWRLLVPGMYTVRVSARGYNATEQSVVVTSDRIADSASWTNFTLQACEECIYDNEAMSVLPNKSVMLVVASVLLWRNYL